MLESTRIEPLRPSFVGHETFPLRLLWLKKAHEAVKGGVDARFFHRPEAIATFGVGRNMALSMRFWAEAAGTISENAGVLDATDFGSRLLGDDAWDPFLERAASIWLIHFHIAGDPRRTTPFYAFNRLVAPEFDAPVLQRGLEEFVRSFPALRASPTTIKRDIEVLLRGYVSRRTDGGEDAAEPLLAELGIVREARLGGHYEMVRGPKPTLPDEVFAYALDRYWRSIHETSPALTLEQVCFAPGSPGRVFKLDEQSVATRLLSIEGSSLGAFRWTDTAGLKQVQRVTAFDGLNVLDAYFSRGRR